MDGFDIGIGSWWYTQPSNLSNSQYGVLDPEKSNLANKSRDHRSRQVPRNMLLCESAPIGVGYHWTSNKCPVGHAYECFRENLQAAATGAQKPLNERAIKAKATEPNVMDASRKICLDIHISRRPDVALLVLWVLAPIQFLRELDPSWPIEVRWEVDNNERLSCHFWDTWEDRLAEFGYPEWFIFVMSGTQSIDLTSLHFSRQEGTVGTTSPMSMIGIFDLPSLTPILKCPLSMVE